MRTRTKVTLGIIVVILVLPIAFLLPAHLQVRRVEPPLPTTEQLRALLHQPNGPVAIHYVNTSEQQMPGGELVHSVFLVEWANGDLFMIDSGMPADVAAQFGKTLEWLMNGSPATVHGSITHYLGDAVQRVRGVGYTHLHQDHTEGTREFCAARGSGVQLVQTELQATEHNFNTRGGADLIAHACFDKAPLQGEIILQTPKFPGLGVIALGGHTPDSTMFAVPVGDTLYLFSGDITNSKKEILDDAGKGFFYSYILVPEHVDRSAALRKWLRQLTLEKEMRVVVSHDLGDVRASGIEPLAGAPR